MPRELPFELDGEITRTTPGPAIQSPDLQWTDFAGNWIENPVPKAGRVANDGGMEFTVEIREIPDSAVALVVRGLMRREGRNHPVQIAMLAKVSRAK